MSFIRMEYIHQRTFCDYVILLFFLLVLYMLHCFRHARDFETVFGSSLLGMCPLQELHIPPSTLSRSANVVICIIS